MTKLRCAIYTRKSSEEGLEQEFNSLHAQREACEAYIKSQKHEGWGLIATAYNDGGISGGTMARPALQQLLKDIAAGKIDIVVVYKVDRLTRALADFARMVELFDTHRVSFVSVTQQFNTTSSMGRLTLNVLLSFAQFEREVTGERIRDKIKASKAKGMWMGGSVPLGYKVEEKKLIPEPTEAATVRHVFTRYLEIGCVRLLMQDLKKDGHRSRKGHPFDRGQLYHMLSNPIYIGKVRHKDAVHEGQHDAILDAGLWEVVQAKLAENRNGVKARRMRKPTQEAPLVGKLFDASGERLVMVQAKKKERRYRYYVSESLVTGTKETAPNGWRLPAKEIERIVVELVVGMLKDTEALLDALRGASVAAHLWPSVLHRAEAMAAADALAEYVQRVVLEGEALTITLDLAPLVPTTMHTKSVPQSASTDGVPSSTIALTRCIPMQIQRRGIEMRLVLPSSTIAPANLDPTLIRAIARAHHWWEELCSGEVANLHSLAQREGTDPAEITRMLRLVFLAPDIIERIVEGRQAPELNRQKMMRLKALPCVWKVQRTLLGM